MKKLLLIGVITLVILIPLTVQVAFSDPGIAPGVLADVYYSGTTNSVPWDGNMWVVVQGGSYQAHLTDIEYTGKTDVFIKGKYTDGTSWIITLEDQIISGGEIITDPFTIFSTAGCTITVAYSHEGHMARDPSPPPTVAHMKTYYDDEEPFDNPVPCEKFGIPEFPFTSAVAISLGLIGALFVRRRQKKLK